LFHRELRVRESVIYWWFIYLFFQLKIVFKIGGFFPKPEVGLGGLFAGFKKAGSTYERAASGAGSGVSGKQSES